MNYAGLPRNKYHALPKKICPKGAGAVFTFGLKGGYEAGVKLVSSVKLFSHLANIGDTRSLDHPSGLDHASPAHRRAAQGGRRRPRRGAAVGRHRGRGRHHRRPRAGACRLRAEHGRSAQGRGVLPASTSANGSRSILPPLRIRPMRLPCMLLRSLSRAASGAAPAPSATLWVSV